jgi:hypothetical protein
MKPIWNVCAIVITALDQLVPNIPIIKTGEENEQYRSSWISVLDFAV